MNPTPKAVVFDVGGVLLELDFPSVFQKMAARSPRSSDEIMSFFWPERRADGECDSTPLAKATAGRLSAEETARIVHSGIGFQGTIEELTALYHSLFPGRIEETLQLFTEIDLPLGILSNTNAWCWPEAARLLPELKHAQEIVLSFEVGMVKPDPKLFTHLASRFALHPSELIFIDDSADIIDRACSLGLDGIVFTSPAQLRSELARRGILNLPTELATENVREAR